jgi:hypothetical protein
MRRDPKKVGVLLFDYVMNIRIHSLWQQGFRVTPIQRS